MQETIIKIEGMSCGHCKAAVEKALKAVPGIETAVVNLKKSKPSSRAMQLCTRCVKQLKMPVMMFFDLEKDNQRLNNCFDSLA